MGVTMNLKATVLVFAAICAVCRSHEFHFPEKSLNKIYEGNLKFARILYNELKSEKGNIVFSPYSAHTILALMYSAAGGTTESMLAEVLSLDGDRYELLRDYRESYWYVFDHFSAVYSSQNENKIEYPCTMKLYNKVFYRFDYGLSSSFGYALSNAFFIRSEPAEFAGYPKCAARQVNRWMEGASFGKTKDYYTGEEFDNDTILVLVSNLDFRAPWVYRFEVLPEKRPFYLDAAKKVAVNMMKALYTHINVKEDPELDATIIELPFNNYNRKNADLDHNYSQQRLWFNMLVILPNKQDGIVKLEEKLAGTDFKTLMSNSTAQPVELLLPKFMIQGIHDLQMPLTDAGLGILFDKEKCNLTNMIEGNKKAHISKVTQNEIIEINEFGCNTNAVVTGQTLYHSNSHNVTEYRKIEVDHPFVVMINTRDMNSKGMPLYVGRVMDPSQY